MCLCVCVLYTERLGYGHFQERILVPVGLCFASSSMEMLLSFRLAVVLQNEWHLTQEQTDALSGAVFAGALLGNLVLGPLGDKLGRKPIFVWTACILSVAGLATAVSSNYHWLVLCRLAVGFGVGGMAVPFDALAEFVPRKRRGTHLLLVEYFWTVGTMLVPLIAYLCFSESMNHQSDSTATSSGGWRLFCAWCAVPSVLTTLVGLYLIPESPRWLLLQGRDDQALEILRTAAMYNDKNPVKLFPHDMQLAHDHGAVESSNICDLFSVKHWKTTLLLWGVWACQYFVYFGAIMAITLVFMNNNGEQRGDQGTSDFGAIFISALAEFVGTTVIIYLIDRIGRIPSQAISYLTGGVAIFVLCQLASHTQTSLTTTTPTTWMIMVVAAFVARLSLMSGTCATWVSTAEIVPTEIRTTSHSTANAIGSLSGFFSPYVVSNETSFPTIGRVILLLSAMTSFLVLLLPETNGKSMGLTSPSSKKANRNESFCERETV